MQYFLLFLTAQCSACPLKIFQFSKTYISSSFLSILSLKKKRSAAFLFVPHHRSTAHCTPTAGRCNSMNISQIVFHFFLIGSFYFLLNRTSYFLKLFSNVFKSYFIFQSLVDCNTLQNRLKLFLFGSSQGQN